MFLKNTKQNGTTVKQTLRGEYTAGIVRIKRVELRENVRAFLRTVRDNEASAKRDLTVLRLDFIHRLVNCIDDKRF